MRRATKAPTPKEKPLPKSEGIKPEKIHGKKHSRSRIRDIEPIAKRDIFKESLQNTTNFINEKQTGKPLNQEEQWILELNDIVNDNKKWADNPAAANAYAFAYLGIMSGEITLDSFSPEDINKILTPDEGKKRVEWNHLLHNFKKGVVKDFTSEEIAENTQELLKQEFKIAQLAFLPEEQFHLLEIKDRTKQKFNKALVKRLVKQGPRVKEILLDHDLLSINQQLLEKLNLPPELTKNFKLDNQPEFRQLIHELSAGSIFEELNKTDFSENANIENLTEPVKKVFAKENLEKVFTQSFSERNSGKKITEYSQMRESAHKDLPESDWSNIDIIFDLATHHPDAYQALIDKIPNRVNLPENPTIDEIKKALTKNNIDQNDLANSLKPQILNIMNNGPWDLKADLTLTFLERKIETAKSLEIKDFNIEKANKEFWQSLDSVTTAVGLVSGKLTMEQLKENNVSKKILTGSQSLEQFSYENEDGNWEMKIILSKQKFQEQENKAKSPETHLDKAIKIVAQEEYNDTHPEVLNAYLQDAKTKAAIIAQTKLDISLERLGSEVENLDKKTLDHNFTLLYNQELNKFIDQSGNPITTNSETYNQMMDDARINIAKTSGRHKVQKLQQELTEQSHQEFTQRHMTAKTAKQIDSTHFAVLDKLDQLSPEVLKGSGIKKIKKTITDITGPANKPLNIQAVQNHIQSHPDEISSSDISLWLTIFPELARSILEAATTDNQQEINKMFT